MTIAENREQAVAAAVAAIRDIEARDGVTPESLKAIRAQLIDLANQTELFPASDFPGPEDGVGDRLYTLSMDDDKRFALYMNRGGEEKDTPPHNHTTWAVVVGVRGEEHNKFYRRGSDRQDARASLEVYDEVTVKPGVGVCMMPEDIHSIHMRGDDVKMHLHMYGLAISELSERVKFDLETGEVAHFEAHPDAQ